MRVMLEIGPHGKKVVAVAPDWPGLERSGKTGDAAMEKLRDYLPRYARTAELAEQAAEFTGDGATMDVIEEYPGTGSTDFWGISFGHSNIDREALSDAELAREMTLMRAAWAFFDEVRVRVSADLRTGPRGGGRSRNIIVRHVVRSEQEDFAKKLGLRRPELPQGVQPDEAVVRAQRAEYCATIRQFHAEHKAARSWPLRYLIRHTAYHTLDHTWEMEDRDLSATQTC